MSDMPATGDGPAEPQPDTPAEAQADAPAEAQPDTPAEAQTDAPAEAQPDTPAEAQTDAPAEAQTDAPAEAQADAPAEAQADAPAEQAQTDAPAEQAPPDRKPPAQQAPDRNQPTVVVRYGLMGTVGQFRHNLKAPPTPGMEVVVRTDRGVELGQVVADVCEKTGCRGLAPGKLAEFLKANGPEYPFRRDGKVLRQANHQDIIDHRHLAGSAREEAAFCRQQVEELKLKMKLVAVEHLLGGERIIFCFSAESRVDFRELVRRLAAQYRTRIEMRQVGARDEARLVADYERCGRQCCCRVFLKQLKPISMRMAKTQKATLDPPKISGRCGRLMCCLRFEDSGYEELRAKLPKKNTWVRTPDVTGRVVDTQILTQLVRLETTERTRVVVANEEIVERDVPPPPPSEPPAPARKRPPEDTPKPRRTRREAPAETGGVPAPAEQDRPPAPAPTRQQPATGETPQAPAPGDQPPRPAEGAAEKKPHRRRGKGARGGQGDTQQQRGAQSKRKRRRRRKKN